MSSDLGVKVADVFGARIGEAVRELFEESDEARMLLTLDRRVVLVNRSFEVMFDRPRERVLGEPARVLIPTRVADDYEQTYQRLMANASVGDTATLSVNLWGVRGDGSEFPVRVLCRLLRHVETPMLSVVVLDRSEGQRAGSIRDFLDAVHSGNLIVDAAGHIVMANERIQQLFGYAEDELVGQQVELLVPAELRHRHVQLREQFSALAREHEMGQGTRVLARRRDGSTFPVRVQLSSLGSQDEMLISVTVRDISEIEQLRGESDRLKEQFLATVSHELRTPLTSIIGSAEMLSEEVDAIEDPALRGRLERFTAMILRGARRQYALVEDLLTLTSVDRGDARPRGGLTDVMVVVEDVLHERAAQAGAKGVDLTSRAEGLPVLVRADERWLSRALDCLVANAVKFAPAGGEVLVSVGSSAESVWVEVADTGPGIPADEQEQVFRRLYRGRAAVRDEIPGTGLGLAIARSVVEACDGTLAVVPTGEGESGARLRMTLPALQVDDEVRLS